MPFFLLLVQICLLYPSSWQQIQFSKIWICHCLVYMAKYPHAKNYINQEYILRKMCHRWMERQTDGQMNWTDLIGPLLQRWRFDHVFWKFKNKIFFKIIVSHREKINTRKECKGIQHNSVFKEFKIKWSLRNLWKITYLIEGLF